MTVQDKRIVFSAEIPQPGGAYSQGIISNGFLFSAGLGPHDAATRQVVGDSIEAQTCQLMSNVAALLADQGMTFADVVKTTVHLANLPRDFSGFDTVYRDAFITDFPVRTTVGSALNGFLVEMDIVARCVRD